MDGFAHIEDRGTNWLLLVQEKGLWRTKSDDVAGWYRRRGFGVPTKLYLAFGTGDGLPGYQRRVGQ